MDRLDGALERTDEIDQDRPLVVRPGPAPTTPEREEQVRKWRSQHADYAEWYNKFVEENGILLERYRAF